MKTVFLILTLLALPLMVAAQGDVQTLGQGTVTEVAKPASAQVNAEDPTLSSVVDVGSGGVIALTGSPAKDPFDCVGICKDKIIGTPTGGGDCSRIGANCIEPTKTGNQALPSDPDKEVQ